MDDLVPAQWQEAAESVRAHLVMLRGGAPFLSPADAYRLVGWLEQGVEVSALILSLERAAAFRHRQRLAGKPTRLPLSLGTAARHLGKAEPSALPAKSKKKPPRAASDAPSATSTNGAGPHPLLPLADALQAMAKAGDPLAEQLSSLGRDLLALDPRGDLVVEGAALFRAFMQAAWSALDPSVRSQWIHDALPPDDEIEDDARAMLDAEEHARGRLRADYPFLTTATLSAMVGLNTSEPRTAKSKVVTGTLPPGPKDTSS